MAVAWLCPVIYDDMFEKLVPDSIYACKYMLFQKNIFNWNSLTKSVKEILQQT